MKKTSPLALSAMALLVAASSAAAATSVNVSINGYLPAPPGVHVYVDAGRPFYRDNGRVVYLERDERHHKKKHGHAYGHREREGRGGGHGEHGGHR